jgi:hypothetical protein
MGDKKAVEGLVPDGCLWCVLLICCRCVFLTDILLRGRYLFFLFDVFGEMVIFVEKVFGVSHQTFGIEYRCVIFFRVHAFDEILQDPDSE